MTAADHSIVSSPELPRGEVWFFCLPPKEQTFASIEDMADWYIANPGKFVRWTNVGSPKTGS